MTVKTSVSQIDYCLKCIAAASLLEEASKTGREVIVKQKSEQLTDELLSEDSSRDEEHDRKMNKHSSHDDNIKK